MHYLGVLSPSTQSTISAGHSVRNYILHDLLSVTRPDYHLNVSAITLLSNERL